MSRAAPGSGLAMLSRYPSLFEINTRAWLWRLSREAGKPITLTEIDDVTLDGFVRQGFDWIWLLSVWQTGAASRAVSRSNPTWRAEFQSALPDLTEEDICGSGFAISAYEVDEALGGKATRSLWPRHRRTTAESKPIKALGSSPMGAILISPAGRIRCSSTMPIPRCKRRKSRSWPPSPNNAMGCAAIWRCFSCRKSSSAAGA